MRRLAVAMLLFAAAAIGAAHWIVAQKILAAAPAAGSYEAASRCAGQLLWLPVGWLFGPFLLFVPQGILAWFLEPLPARYREGQLTARALLVLRFAGAGADDVDGAQHADHAAGVPAVLPTAIPTLSGRRRPLCGLVECASPCYNPPSRQSELIISSKEEREWQIL